MIQKLKHRYQFALQVIKKGCPGERRLATSLQINFTDNFHVF